MPTIRKLDADEVRRGGKKLSARAQTQREYDNYLSEFSPDEYGEAVITEEESKLTVRNRLRAAAQRRGLEIDFLRTSGPAIRFQLTTPSGEQATNGVEEADEAGAEGGSENGAAETPAPRASRRRRKEAAAAE